VLFCSAVDVCCQLPWVLDNIFSKDREADEERERETEREKHIFAHTMGETGRVACSTWTIPRILPPAIKRVLAEKLVHFHFPTGVHYEGRCPAAWRHGSLLCESPAAWKQEARRLGRKKGRAVASKRRNSKRKEIKERLVKEIGAEEFRKIVQSDIQKREGACRT